MELVDDRNKVQARGQTFLKAADLQVDRDRLWWPVRSQERRSKRRSVSEIFEQLAEAKPEQERAKDCGNHAFGHGVEEGYILPNVGAGDGEDP